MNKATMISMVTCAILFVILRTMNLPSWIFLTIGLVILFGMIIKHYWFNPKDS